MAEESLQKGPEKRRGAGRFSPSARIRKPNALLYFFAGLYMKLYNKRHFDLKVTGEKPKGPAVIISNHTSNADWKLIAGAVWPRRINFLVTYHWFTFKKLSPWLRIIGAIPKYQFATDIESVRKMQYVLSHNRGMVYIAPEGTIYANGKLGNISPSIAKLIKFLKVPVYSARIQGAGLGMAKWTAHPHRCHVSVETHRLLSAEQTQSLDRSQIMERLTNALAYNEFEYQKLRDIHTDGTDLAEGFETMFYRCPSCGKEFTLRTRGNTVECTACGAKAELNSSFRFVWEGQKQFFDNYIEWYDWQYEKLKEEVARPDFRLEEEVDYGTDKPGIDNYVKVGHGVMTLTRSGWDYSGTFEGKQVTEHDSAAQVFLATLKPGLHFELPYRFGHCRVFYPANGLTSMKWHLASRAITEQAAQQAE